MLDLTQKSDSTKKTPSPDVIVLSDEEDSAPSLLVNGTVNGFCDEPTVTHEVKERNKYSISELKDHRKLIRRLHEELRNEEMKLILLKKLRQSQQTQSVAPTPPPSSQVKEGYGSGHKAALNERSTVVRSGSQMNSTPPPPLVRANQMQQQLHSKSIIHQSSHHSINSLRGHSQRSVSIILPCYDCRLLFETRLPV